MVATGGNRWQIGSAQKAPEQAKTVALGCDQLREAAHGKEGVDGSSPSEGFAKVPQICAFSFELTCTNSILQWVWSRLWSFQIQRRGRRRPATQSFGANGAPGRRPCVSTRPVRLSEELVHAVVVGTLRKRGGL